MAAKLNSQADHHAPAFPVPQPADWTDPFFTQPYVDVDEWRDAPVRHRYIHGGFKGTDACFSIYLPPKVRYQGRFFQPLMAVSGNENTAQVPLGQRGFYGFLNPIEFAFSSGGYLVESNLGKKDMYPNPTDHGANTIIGYRASAAVAKHSRGIAAEMYGKHRPYGYVYGGSGGSYKTISCVESTVGVWDGSVPFIVPSPVAAPNIYAVIGHAMRILKNKMPMIVDAIEPGGNSDMYAGLNAEEAAALRELMRMGFPPRSLYKWRSLAMGAMPHILDNFKVWDPSYWTDFWQVPGYLGADSPEALKPFRIQKTTTIKKVVMADEARKLGLPVPLAAWADGEAGKVPAAFIVEDLPKDDLVGCSFIVRDEIEVYINLVIGDAITVGYGPVNGPRVNSIKAGDPVRFDNSTWLALQTYHRHQVPPREEGFYIFDQFRGPDGKPLYPQRAVLAGPRMNDIGGGSAQTGRFTGKMIMVETLMDEHAAPWNADWYRSRAKEALGNRFGDNFRLWHIDHGLHGGPMTPADNVHVIDFTGALEQALRDLSAWVEKGTPPPASTDYKMVESQVVVPPGAAERRGIQPVVTLSANGGMRADVAVGAPVNFVGTIETARGTGKVVKAEWDFEGRGDYPVKGEIKHADGSGERTIVSTTYAFSKPGTYFPVLRVASQRQPDGTPYTSVANLDRVRVVVT